ncbi:BlaI/MecI/CopY family transcriptional regulator [filamentous cyanobacterium LEGE 11480]|uniref:BlaI/MecI/CopY family transcriptional regulator n=1 Tax=Romeriopsis navalis LEGE 11480 TaxID=2777977 RepID=A0A928Z0V7_9CYAN|nr:BlaI/MecI/CopY family transcriptional regulator [Romeriopsis navalis]MBE9028681.1 BlaI/MecI/CopY family transcriptional regulator [Romeriopsis navalis LEGE 11480]
MGQLPNYRPKQLSLGPLEREILEIVWSLDAVTVRDVHQQILADPSRELAYTSVTTVLKRLTNKGWLACNRQDKSFVWHALVSRAEANALFAYEQLHQFLAVGNPDIVAAFADQLDQTSVDQLDSIAQKLRQARQQRTPPVGPGA